MCNRRGKELMCPLFAQDTETLQKTIKKMTDEAEAKGYDTIYVVKAAGTDLTCVMSSPQELTLSPELEDNQGGQ